MDTKIDILENEGVKLSEKKVIQKILAGILAGVYIGFGGLFFLLLASNGYTKLVASIGFCLGLILVVLAGADLFTGSHLFIVSALKKHLTWKKLTTNWIQLFIYNLIGSVFIAVIFYFSRPNLEIEILIKEISLKKLSLSYSVLIFRGILCNWLVCLAVWMCIGMKSVPGKILCILFPISAFVALGFEHSVANMFFFSLGFLFGEGSLLEIFSNNLLPVTIGNFIGGAVFVGGLYFYIYKNNDEKGK